MTLDWMNLNPNKVLNAALVDLLVGRYGRVQRQSAAVDVDSISSIGMH